MKKNPSIARKNPTVTFQAEDEAVQDLLERAEKRGRGEKSKLINEAIRLKGDQALLNVLEREAPGVSPADIGEKIHVRGKRAKTRQQRYVEIVPALKQWLALPCPGEQQGPFAGDWPIKNLRRRFEAVRAKAGLITLEPKTRPKKRGNGTVVVDYVVTETQWGQDIMRHTFASAFYAVHGAERTIEALGHGDYDMLFSHYRRLMTKEEGQRILSICPADVSIIGPDVADDAV